MGLLARFGARAPRPRRYERWDLRFGAGSTWARSNRAAAACAGGIAVHLAGRVAARASPGETLVTGTVKDLVAGSGIEFEERGSATLKGIPGRWRLYSVRST